MYNEELIEEGIVTKSYNGLAEVLIFNSDRCEECSAKIYCKPSNSSERTLIVRNPLGAKIGDKVRIVIKGSKILSASFLIYGVPLVILIVGIFIGMNFFKNNSELLSTITAIAIVVIYFLFFYLFTNSPQNKNKLMPEITSISFKN